MDATKVRTARRRGAKVDGQRPRDTDLLEQLSRVSGRLMVAEKELARLSGENARLTAENSLLRARLDARAARGITTLRR